MGANGFKGGQFWPKVTHVLAPKALKNLKNGLKWLVLGAAGATNFEKIGRISQKSSIFAKKTQDFIAWKCIAMHKISKKDEKNCFT